MQASTDIVPPAPKPLDELPVRIITPHSGAQAFGEAVTSIVSNFAKSRNLAWRMLVRDTSAQYRQSLLGYLWLLLPPVATVLVWVFLNKQNLVSINTGKVPYPLFVMTGTVLWTAFNSSVMAMQGIMGGAGGALSKVNFPHEALILAAFGKSLLDSLPPVLLLLPVILFYGGRFTPQMLLFPVGFLTAMLLGSALGLLFAPIGALYGDVGRGIQFALRFGFFVTPVVYPLPPSGLTRTLMLWNPVTAPLVTSRAWLTGGEAPLVPEMMLVCVASLLILGFATLAFKVAMPHVIERMNS